jgi:mono/diheme cytochrome c family protein
MSTIAASKWHIAVLLMACAAGYEVPSWAQSQPIATSSGGDAKLATGPEGTYSRTCGYCHGANVGPVILGLNIPPEAIQTVVRSGMGAMPAFRPTEISDADLKRLSEWISHSPAETNEHGK